MFGGSFAPAGWMTCDGQLLPISEYDTLFNLIGTTYGGDGQSTFALPNLAARVPIHIGNNGTSTYNLADNGGVTSVTLTTNQIPLHTHPAIGDNNAATTNTGVPTNGFYGNTTPNNIYSQGLVAGRIHPMMTLPVQGGSQPHDNMQPYLAITFIISLFGIFPSPT
ncbi:MAG TPA: tail fiber protein [Candidatus Elarobacter sp.]